MLHERIGDDALIQERDRITRVTSAMGTIG
jgi:hypothetical protein